MLIPLKLNDQRRVRSFLSLGYFSLSPVKGKTYLLRKEVIQTHLPVRLPCYDLVLLAKHTFDVALLAVRQTASGALDSGDLTGGVYKTRERIHRSMADLRLLANPTSRRRIAASDLN